MMRAVEGAGRRRWTTRRWRDEADERWLETGRTRENAERQTSIGAAWSKGGRPRMELGGPRYGERVRREREEKVEGQ